MGPVSPKNGAGTESQGAATARHPAYYFNTNYKGKGLGSYRGCRNENTDKTVATDGLLAATG